MAGNVASRGWDSEKGGELSRKCERLRQGAGPLGLDETDRASIDQSDFSGAGSLLKSGRGLRGKSPRTHRRSLPALENALCGEGESTPPCLPLGLEEPSFCCHRCCCSCFALCWLSRWSEGCPTRRSPLRPRVR
nr:uncharacterized protein LOC105722707 [Aotus nancymaae]